MNQGHLAKLFGAFGLILIAVSVNTWLASQGGEAILKTPLLHDERPAMALLGLLISSFLLLLMSAVGFLYARRSDGSWHDRIPAVWLKALNTASVEGKAFQVATLVIFVGVPVASLVHFVRIIWHAKLCVLDTKNAPVAVSESWLEGIAGASNQIRLVENLLPDGTCGKGIQVFPGWEFLMLAGLMLISLAVTILFLLQVSGAFKQLDRRNIVSDRSHR